MSNTRDSLGDQLTLNSLINLTLTELEEDGVTYLPAYALYKNQGLATIILPNVTSLSQQCLGSTTIKNLVLPNTEGVCSFYSNGYDLPSYIVKKFGGVFVPDELLSLYKKQYQSLSFISLSRYPINNNDYSSINDSWSQIITAINNNTYKTKYRLGDTKLLTLNDTNNTQILMEIIAFDEDELPNGGRAAITWFSKLVYPTAIAMNSTNTTAGGWPSSDLYTYLNTTIFNNLPPILQTSIVPVNKSSVVYNPTDRNLSNIISQDKLWILSLIECIGQRYTNGTFLEQGKPYLRYAKTYKSMNRAYDYRSFIKPCADSINVDNTQQIWFRNNTGSSTFLGMNGSWSTSSPQTFQPTSNSVYTTFGFCLGQSSDEITDSWDTIFENEENDTYLQKYSIGLTKHLTIDNWDYAATIIAFNEDILADDNNTKAKITWLLREQYHDSVSICTNSSDVTLNWSLSNFHLTTAETWLAKFPINIQQNIKTVKKMSYDRTTQTDISSEDKLWPLSMKEIFGNIGFETSGSDYSTYLQISDVLKNSDRMGTSVASSYIVRTQAKDSPSNSSNYYCNCTYNETTDTLSYVQNIFPSNSCTFRLGFCT